LLLLHEGACESQASPWDAPSLPTGWLHYQAKCGRLKDIPIVATVTDHGGTDQGRADPSNSKDLLPLSQVFSLDVLE